MLNEIKLDEKIAWVSSLTSQNTRNEEFRNLSFILFDYGFSRLEISKILNLSLKRINKYLRWCVRGNQIWLSLLDGSEDFYDSKGNYWVTIKYLAKISFSSQHAVEDNLAKAGIGFKKIFVKHKHKVAYFYPFDEVLVKCSKLRIKIEINQKHELKVKDLRITLNYLPSSVSLYEYLVLISLLKYKLLYDTWPRPAALAKTEPISELNPSVSGIKTSIQRLERKKYLTRCSRFRGDIKADPTGRNIRFIIHRGPAELCYKAVTSPCCKEIVMVPRDFFIPLKPGKHA